MTIRNSLKAVAYVVFLVFYSEEMYAHPKDSLAGKDYEYLLDGIKKAKNDRKRREVYLEAFLVNAKSGHDWERLTKAYRNYVDNSLNELKIPYADSMVYAANKSYNDKTIGAAYLSRGIAYYGLKNHELALRDYITASPYLERANDDYLIYKLKYNIAHERYYLGQNEEAIELFKECLHFFRINNPRPYLNTIHSLGLVYNKAGDYKKSEDMVALGVIEANRLKIHIMDGYFLHLDGLNHYYKRNYNTAIRKLKQSMPLIEANNDFANLTVANFYIGKSYWDMKLHSESIPYFKKVDDEFRNTGYMRADLRENYELLIDFYKYREEHNRVLVYVDQLLRADSVLQRTHDRLYEDIHKNYDTKALVREKEKIQFLLDDERSHKKILMGIITLLCLATILLLYIWQRNRRKQERIFRELMQENKKVLPKPDKNIPRPLEIPQDTVDKVLSLLEKWEKEKGFLDRDITLSKLALYLETNTRYTSDIIAYYRGKPFNLYVNSIKVEYIIGQLKIDRYKRMYTNDALAEDAGFTTTQRFVSAFKTYAGGISPTVFITKLKQQLEDKIEGL